MAQRQPGPGPAQLSQTAAPARWRFLLFGRFSATSPRGDAIALRGRRIQELLGYVLVFRGSPHHREVLAESLWGEEGHIGAPKKQLRQALWQLQLALRQGRGCPPLLKTSGEWIELGDHAELWTDVGELERAFERVRGRPAEDLDEVDAARLRSVVDLYRGDLLEGCYQNWCVYERERLKTIWLALLEKLLGHCETHGLPEEGLVYGERLLAQDAAHEPTHRRMMRLHWMAGDRVRALRQYLRCTAALRDELGVEPSLATSTLFEQIRTDAGFA